MSTEAQARALAATLDALVGRKFRRRKNGKQETRLVIDRTLGFDVVWRDRWSEHRTPWTDFEQWLRDAKEIT